MYFTVVSSGQFDGKNLYVEQNGTFDISCMAEGGPDNVHTWMLNDFEITNDTDMFSITASTNHSMSVSVLTVSSVDAAIHKGSYVCDVVNQAGDHSAELTVYGKLCQSLHQVVF